MVLASRGPHRHGPRDRIFPKGNGSGHVQVVQNHWLPAGLVLRSDRSRAWGLMARRAGDAHLCGPDDAILPAACPRWRWGRCATDWCGADAGLGHRWRSHGQWLAALCRHLAILSLGPVWILAVWASLAVIVTRSLALLHRHPWAALLLGVVGGPLAYLGAARGWVAATFADPAPGCRHACAHRATAMPLLAVLARRWSVAARGSGQA